MSALVKAELSATCNTLGYLHDDKYTIDPQCFQSVRDLIRFLRRDDDYHEIRRYLGEAKIVQSDLIHIIENCSEEQNDLFDITVRLLVNLTSPVVLLYKEELPAEKVGRNIYLSILGHLQDSKIAFTSIDAWKKISSKLSDLFEVDWSERSEDMGLQIERMLVLIRNVLQIPADDEGRVENDVNIHDQVLWGLRQSQILELLLYISSSRYEEQYFIHILEIFSLILREQDSKLLASCEISRSTEEKEKDNNSLIDIRSNEKYLTNKKMKQFSRHSNFGGTFVLQNVKSISDKDLIYHKPLQKVSELGTDKKRLKTPKNRIPERTERDSRRSTFSVRLFLKELCVEFLSSSYNGMMSVVKDKLVSGKALPNDESYYFWALKFFMEFNRLANLDVKHVSETINVATFHFILTQVENCYDHIMTEKKKINLWVKRLHIIMKAYRELLETLGWMDRSQNQSMSDVLKSQLFYMPEYRELVLYCLFKYDPAKYSKDYLRTLIETTHLFFKLFKGFCDKRNNKVVIQTKTKKKEKKTKKKKETTSDKWSQIKENVRDTLASDVEYPDISPFDPDFDMDSEEQKESAMKRIQGFLFDQNILDAIGLLRSARRVWPEQNFFGYDGMSLENEFRGVEEIFLTSLGNELNMEEEDGENDEDEPEARVECKEESLNYSDFAKRLVNKKVIEGCAVLLENYAKNTDFTNHCVIKLLHRIGWECSMPSMLYQTTLFGTLLNILKDNRSRYKEINKFTVYLFRKFRENAAKNPKIFMELLFWKDIKVACEVENGYNDTSGGGRTASWSDEQEDELRRLCGEFEMAHPENADKVDWIMANLIDKTRTRRAVTKKLRDLYLLPAGPVKKISKRLPKEWSPEETFELNELFDQFKDAIDVVGVIADRLSVKRPKNRVRDMIVELGLVENRAQLRKKRSKQMTAESESESESDEEEDEGAEVGEAPPEVLPTFSMREQKESLKKIYDLGLTEALEWVKECFVDYRDDYDPADGGYPLLAIEKSHADALENEQFVDMLTKIGATPPMEQQYWRLPGTFSRHHLDIMIEIMQKNLDGNLEIDSPQKTNGVDSDDESVSVSKKKALDSDEEISLPSASQISKASYNRRQVGSDNESSSSTSSRNSMTNKSQNKHATVSSDDEHAVSSTSKVSNAKSKTNTIGSDKDSSEDSRDGSSRPAKKKTVTQSSRNTVNSDGESSEDSRSSFTQSTGPISLPAKHAIHSGDETSSSGASRSSFKASAKKKIRSRIKKTIIDSNSDDEEDNVVSSNRSRNCIGSDSGDNSPSSNTFSKRSRMLINSDSEGENVVTNDYKRRKTLIDSDSETESNVGQRKIIIGEDTYEMEK